ncbi:hypothetical protein A3D72_00615 [Candidatus Uhrbacteria bacterium RIFCSPHIGHO2_02_FULL_57_19]|uniref:Uncharacterized protein n=1 Tax=Candidatus Uhrbacteria bacterium RIFCSPHIGHO2_02_FULL_57_19 TaxID=1802391 RepID=A0A1F7U215_9BACT|nr:MAG: hypothetical protein A3D72_00615 [Candidatus Uhrbacteria bacterium RIFCSPHIGHO2_02_FULL_57_19]
MNARHIIFASSLPRGLEVRIVLMAVAIALCATAFVVVFAQIATFGGIPFERAERITGVGANILTVIWLLQLKFKFSHALLIGVMVMFFSDSVVDIFNGPKVVDLVRGAVCFWIILRMYSEGPK